MKIRTKMTAVFLTGALLLPTVASAQMSHMTSGRSMSAGHHSMMKKKRSSMKKGSGMKSGGGMSGGGANGGSASKAGADGAGGGGKM